MNNINIAYTHIGNNSTTEEYAMMFDNNSINLYDIMKVIENPDNRRLARNETFISREESGVSAPSVIPEHCFVNFAVETNNGTEECVFEINLDNEIVFSSFKEVNNLENILYNYGSHIINSVLVSYFETGAIRYAVYVRDM